MGRQVSSGGFSCAWRSLTCWNYFPVGLKNQTLIGLLQHKLADRKRVGEATVWSAIKCRARQLNYLQINLKLQIASELAKLSPDKPPKRIQAPNNYNQFQTSVIFNHSRPVHESVISVRWMSVGGEVIQAAAVFPVREESEQWKDTSAAIRPKIWRRLLEVLMQIFIQAIWHIHSVPHVPQISLECGAAEEEIGSRFAQHNYLCSDLK